MNQYSISIEKEHLQIGLVQVISYHSSILCERKSTSVATTFAISSKQTQVSNYRYIPFNPICLCNPSLLPRNIYLITARIGPSQKPRAESISFFNFTRP